MSLGKQIALCVLLLAAGAALYYLAGREGAVQSTAQAAPDRGARAVPVRLALASPGRVRDRIEAVGTTIARQAVDIVPLAAGRVVEIPVRSGDHVQPDALLVRLDATHEQASLAEAQARLREAELALARVQRLRRNNTVAQSSADEAQMAQAATQAQLERAEQSLNERAIRAPFAGVVGLIRVDIGARVDGTTVVTTLDDLDAVEIEFSVPERFFGQIKPGLAVSAASAAYPGRVFSGAIDRVDTRIGAASRAFRVRAKLPNDDLALPAGMFMHVEVVLSEREALLIPEDAVQAEGDQTFVFAVVDGKAVRRPIALGLRQDGQVEVVSGLDARAPVVREGGQRLRPGAAVKDADS